MVEMQLKSVVFVTLGSDPHSLFLKLNFIFDALSEIICLPFGSQCNIKNFFVVSIVPTIWFLVHMLAPADENKIVWSGSG